MVFLNNINFKSGVEHIRIPKVKEPSLYLLASTPLDPLAVNTIPQYQTIEFFPIYKGSDNLTVTLRTDGDDIPIYDGNLSNVTYTFVRPGQSYLIFRVGNQTRGYRFDVVPDEILEVPEEYHPSPDYPQPVGTDLETLELIPSILAKVLLVIIILRNQVELSRFITRLILGNQKAVKS